MYHKSYDIVQGGKIGSNVHNFNWLGSTYPVPQIDFNEDVRVDKAS